MKKNTILIAVLFLTISVSFVSIVSADKLLYGKDGVLVYDTYILKTVCKPFMPCGVIRIERQAQDYKPNNDNYRHNNEYYKENDYEQNYKNRHDYNQNKYSNKQDSNDNENSCGTSTFFRIFSSKYDPTTDRCDKTSAGYGYAKNTQYKKEKRNSYY